MYAEPVAFNTCPSTSMKAPRINMKTLRQNHVKVFIFTYLLYIIYVNGVSLTITQYPQYPTTSSTVWLTCHIPSFIVGAEWSRNGSRLTTCFPSGYCNPSSRPGYQFYADATTMNITISSINLTLDETTWICRHNGGKDTGSFNLIVYRVSLTITQSPQYPTASSTVWLTCHIPSFIVGADWSRNGSRLTTCLPSGYCNPSSRPGYQFYADATTMNITISSINLTLDETTWICTHDGGYDKGYINLIVYIPVDSVQLKNGTSLTLIENQSAVLVCETAACRPSAAIYWMKNGINITDSPTSAIVTSVGRDLFVSIGTLNYTGQREDNGALLTCVAYNRLDSVKTSLELAITIYYPPFLQGLTSPYKVIENQPLNVKCVVTSNPPVHWIDWSPRGEGYVPSILYFHSVSRNNSGIYSCTAQNTMVPTVGTQQNGTVTGHIQVDVLYGAAIVNLSVHGGNTINENSSAIFNCYVDSNPPSTITWMKEGSSAVLKTESGVVQSNYTINSAECLENYTCTADNGIWKTAKERLELFVRCHPRTDFRLTLETKIYKKHHEAAILRYTVIAYPPPAFTWTFLGNGSESKVLPVSASQHDNGQQSELRITNLDITDFGVYSVIADNSLAPSAIEFFEIIQAVYVPDIPSNVMVTDVKQTSLAVHWNAGDNGGLNQTFHIMIATGAFLSNVYAPDPGYGNSGTQTIENLMANTEYSISMSANNSMGSSSVTNVIKVITLKDTSPSPISAIAGGVTGAIVAVILLVGINIFIWRRYQHKKNVAGAMYENAADAGRSSEKVTVYEGLSKSSGENAYDTLGATNETLVEKYVNLKMNPLTNKTGNTNIDTQNKQT